MLPAFLTHLGCFHFGKNENMPAVVSIIPQAKQFACSHSTNKKSTLTCGFFVFVEMGVIETPSELGIPDDSTVRSVSLTEPLHLANFFVVTDIFSVIVEITTFPSKKS